MQQRQNLAAIRLETSRDHRGFTVTIAVDDVAELEPLVTTTRYVVDPSDVAGAEYDLEVAPGMFTKLPESRCHWYTDPDIAPAEIVRTLAVPNLVAPAPEMFPTSGFTMRLMTAEAGAHRLLSPL